MDYQKLYDNLRKETIDQSATEMINYFEWINGTPQHQKWVNDIVRQLGLFRQIRDDQLMTQDPALYDRMTNDMVTELQKILVEANGAPLIKKQHILFIASDPLDADPLQLGKEMELVEETIKSTKDRDAFIFHKSTHAELVNVTDDIGQFKPDIIHFAGHGTKTGIQLVDHNGLSKELAPEKFGALLNCFENYHPDLIYLNACYSARQAEALLPFTRFVIGFFYAADPDLAVESAQLFYKRLGNGHTYKEAFESTIHNLKDRLPEDTALIRLFER